MLLGCPFYSLFLCVRLVGWLVKFICLFTWCLQCFCPRMRCGGACLIVRMFACSLGVLTGLIVRAFIGWSSVFACACLLIPLNARVLRLVVCQPTWLLVGLEVSYL